MTTRPIIFSGPMVRAIIAGRKTQFRVPVKPQPEEGWSVIPRADREGWFVLRTSAVTHFPVRPRNIGCPLGGPGARVFVQETHVLLDRDGWWDMTQPRDALDPMGRRNGVAYAADANDADSERCRRELGYRWRSPVCMPRWASRLTLEIVAVRVERVHEISVADCHAEGVEPTWDGQPSELERLENAWDRKYAKRGYPWASNPWVFAITFRTITPTAADAAETKDTHQ